MNRKYYVYIATNWNNKVLYTGITNDVVRRMYEHKEKLIPGFTTKYNVNKLVYSSEFNSPVEAITAEKKIKGWTREKKIKLIKSINPEFQDVLKDSSAPTQNDNELVQNDNKLVQNDNKLVQNDNKLVQNDNKPTQNDNELDQIDAQVNDFRLG